MPAPSKRPSPPARMVELLITEKQALLAQKGHVTKEDFELAWATAWAQMVAERAWPHATAHRRAWRAAMLSTRSESRAAFLDTPTPFALVTAHLSQAAANMCVTLAPAEIPKTLLAAIATVETEIDHGPQLTVAL